MDKPIVLVANGDLRTSANQKCETAQSAMEAQISAAVIAQGRMISRGHAFDPAKGHGFIDSQKMGLEVFKHIDKDSPIIVAEAVWQYSHHLLAGLMAHRGPILTLANWSGTWPGLVGMLNLNGSLTKAGVNYSTLWSEDFTDSYFVDGLKSWLQTGKVAHDSSHVAPYTSSNKGVGINGAGEKIAREILSDRSIMGIFDEGCMGMYNAIIPDELLHSTGVFKERLSQSALYAEMLTVTSDEARGIYNWLLHHGMTFQFGPNEGDHLTENQVLEQCKMYVAAVRIADDFGCGTIGIQYQQGLKDLCPASDLAEGLLNNVQRPPVLSRDGARTLYEGEALPHFNEVDECAGLDALVTNKVWNALGIPPETTLHDLRWGRPFTTERGEEYVWVFEISGAAPPEHNINGFSGTTSERQPPMYFRLGGGTVKGIAKPGAIVWSRVYVSHGELMFDTGTARVISLPLTETQDRWDQTTPQWPIMHAVLDNVSRDQMMGRHKSNHIQVAYVPSELSAKAVMEEKASAMLTLGLKVFVCGT